jgi:RNA polymerase sigma-70 factor, ECF subfamily
MISDLTDDALLAELTRDNRLAFHELTTRYIDRIWRISFRVVRNRQDAEDVTQEVFTTVWNRRSDWKPGEAAFSTWLYRVAVNRSIDFCRKRKVENIELEDDAFESDYMSADDMVSNRETQEMLMGCLKELPEKQMLALLYFYYEEMEISEICLRLRASEDSVRSLLKRGKVGMRDVIAARFGADHQQQLTAIAPYLMSS